VKNVFWEVLLCGSCRNRCFGGMYRLHLQGENNQQTKNTLAIASDCSTLQRINHYVKGGGEQQSLSWYFPITADMTGCCFMTGCYRTLLISDVAAKYDMQGLVVGRGGELSDQTNKGGGDSIGTAQLGRPGFMSWKF
jgi:hypothetical protein